MLFKSENNCQLPLDIGHEVSKYMGAGDVGKAMSVCKNWHQFFSNDFIWKNRLLENGFKRDHLENLKNFIQVHSFKEIFQLFQRKSAIQAAYYQHATNKELMQIPIKSSVKTILTDYVYMPDPNFTPEERKKVQRFYLYRCGLKLYSSDVHYTAHHILGDKYVNESEPLRVTLDDISLGTEDSLEIKMLEFCKGNELLMTSLRKLNQTELPLLSLFAALLSLSAKNYGGKGGENQCTSFLIPSHNKIYFINSFRHTIFPSDDWNEEHKIQVDMAIEVNSTGLTLLNYDVSVSNEFYPEAESLLNNIYLIHQAMAGFKGPTPSQP